MAWNRNLPKPPTFSSQPAGPSVRDVSLRGLMEIEFPSSYPMPRSKFSTAISHDGISDRVLQRQQRDRFRDSYFDDEIAGNNNRHYLHNSDFNDKILERRKFKGNHVDYRIPENQRPRGNFSYIPRRDVHPEGRGRFEDCHSDYLPVDEQHRNNHAGSAYARNRVPIDNESFELIKSFLQNTSVEEQSGQNDSRKLPQTSGNRSFSNDMAHDIEVNRARNKNNYGQSLNYEGGRLGIDEVNLSNFVSDLFNSGRLLESLTSGIASTSTSFEDERIKEQSKKDMSAFVQNLYARIESDREKILKNLQKKKMDEVITDDGKPPLHELDPGLPIPSLSKQTETGGKPNTSEAVSQPTYSYWVSDASLYQPVANISHASNDVPSFPSLLGKLLHSKSQTQNLRIQDERKHRQDGLELSSESLASHWEKVKEKLYEQERNRHRRSKSRSPHRTRARHHGRSSKSPHRWSRLSPKLRSPSPRKYRSSLARGPRIPTSRRLGSPPPRLLRSPRRFRSPSPRRFRSPSPRRLRSPSPRRFRSPSPRRLRSPSPRRLRSPSPRRLRSPSPRRLRSPPPAGLRRSSHVGLRSSEMEGRYPGYHRNHESHRSRSPLALQCNEDSPIRLIDALKLVLSALRKSKSNYDLIVFGEDGMGDILLMDRIVKRSLLLGGFQLRFSKVSDHIKTTWQRALTDLLDTALENDYNHEVYVEARAHFKVISVHNIKAHELAEYFRGGDVVMHFNLEESSGKIKSKTKGLLDNRFDIYSTTKLPSAPNVFDRLGDVSRKDVLSDSVSDQCQRNPNSNVFSRLGNKYDSGPSVSDSSRLGKVYDVEYRVKEQNDEDIVYLGENLDEESSKRSTKEKKKSVYSRLGNDVPANANDVVCIEEDDIVEREDEIVDTEDEIVDETKFPKSMAGRLLVPNK